MSVWKNSRRSSYCFRRFCRSKLPTICLSKSNASSYQRNVSVLPFFECLFWMLDQIHEKNCRLFMSICMHKIKVIPPLFLQIRLIKENYNLIKPMLRVTHSFSLYWMSIYMKENQKEPHFISRDIADQGILQFDGMKIFKGKAWQKQLCLIWDLFFWFVINSGHNNKEPIRKL